MTEKTTPSHTLFQRFGLFFYDRLKTTFTIWVALLVFGILSYSVFMQRQGFPNVEVPLSIASGTYFVNNKATVDKDVVKPLSELAMKRSDVKTVTASSTSNSFSLAIEYKDGTTAKAGSAAIEQDAKAAAFLPSNLNINYMPVNASKFNNEYDVMLAVHQSVDTDYTTLAANADRIAQSLNGTEGVSTVKSINPFKTGINPVTGKSVTLQQTFDTVGVRENGITVFYPSVELGVTAKPGTDAVHLEKNINARIAALESQSVNNGIHITVSAGVSENISTQINNLQINLFEGLVVVIIVSLLLISWRAGLATALSMLSVLLITVGVLYALGLTLNTITLFALVLCLGLIVDDTTIMAEAIDAGKRANLSNRDIVAKAMKKVARASTAGTLVTMLAFAPMLFISGILGSFIRVLPITIIVSLAVSLLVSLTLIPFMSRRLLLSSKGKSSKNRNPIVTFEGVVSSGLAKMIRVGKKSRKKAAAIGVVAILISFVFLLGSGVFFSKLKFDIFPSTKDSDALAVTMTFPAGTSVASAETASKQMNGIIADTLGSNLKRVNYLNSGTSMSAMASIELISFKKREVKSPQLVAQLSAALKDFTLAKTKVSQLDAGPPKDDYPFRVQIYGENTDYTKRLAADMAAYLQGKTIKRSNGTTAVIARTQIVGGGDTINRTKAKRLLEVQAGFDADDTSALVSVAQKSVEDKFSETKLKDYKVSKSDVAFDFGNESNNQDSFKTMLLAFPVLLLIMYILLAFQFRSLLQPLLIFTAIPFSFFGVAAGLHFTNNPLSFFVMIGFFALIGIAVNNTILLVDFANQARKEGNGGFESMALAVKARFRPLITTSLTSVLALIPLALSDPFWESLAFTLIFGLLSSTFLVVVSFPYFYLAAEFLRSRYSRRLTIAWIIAVIGVIVILGKVKASLIPLGLAVLVLVMITTWLKGKYVKRLQRNI